MSVKPRQAKLFAALLSSMAACAILLMALGNNPPSAGAFCLNSYYSLEPVEMVLVSRAAQYPGRWNSVEICFSGTKTGNIAQLACWAGLDNPDDVNFHFCICNGGGGIDGQILSTERWLRQLSVVPGSMSYADRIGEYFERSGQSAAGGPDRRDETPTQTSYLVFRSSYLESRFTNHESRSNDRTIRICIIAQPRSNPPTDYQTRRLEALLETLCRAFGIAPESVHYPGRG